MANGLANLLAKKAQTDATDSKSDGAQEPARLPESTSESESVSRSPSTDASPAQRPANPFAKRQNTGSNDSVGSTGTGLVAGSGSDSSDQLPKSRLSSLSLSAGAPAASSNTSGLVAPAVDSLDALDQSTAEGIAPRPSITSAFADETPASKPTRELPEGLTKEQLGFVDLIDGVYEVLHEPDLMGGVIRNIIIELKSNPEYMKLVAPDDIRAWVRGMRESMGLAKIKKTESKAKKSGGAGRKSKLVDSEMLDDLADLGVSIPE